MFALVITALLLATVIVAEPIRSTHTNDQSMYIMEGTDAKPGDDPHMCTLFDRHPLCGASIISDQWLITSAGCAQSYLRVHCGSLNTSVYGVDFNVIKVVRHPDFATNLVNDIALLKIEGTFDFNERLNKIELPVQNELIPDDAVLTVTGWGRFSRDGDYPDWLQTGRVPVMANDVCAERWQEKGITITDRQLCANTVTCYGDGGGPAKYQGKLVGIVSNNWDCVDRRYPDVYTRVSSYVDWIKETIEQ